VRKDQPQYTVGIDPDLDSDTDTDGNQEQTDHQQLAGGTGNSLPVLRSNKRLPPKSRPVPMKGEAFARYGCPRFQPKTSWLSATGNQVNQLPVPPAFGHP
jgi:hypothetical protein